MAGPAHCRRFAAEFANGVQLDVVAIPVDQRPVLVDGEVGIVDKDDRMAQVVTSSRWVATPAQAPEWAMLAWWWLSDVAKYLTRGSLFEAVKKLDMARDEALKLYAVAEATPSPEFGLTSLLDFEPFDVPDRLSATSGEGDHRLTGRSDLGRDGVRSGTVTDQIVGSGSSQRGLTAASSIWRKRARSAAVTTRALGTASP